MYAEIVPLPTAVGPASTTSRGPAPSAGAPLGTAEESAPEDPEDCEPEDWEPEDWEPEDWETGSGGGWLGCAGALTARNGR
jgi:hypothetical protein